MATVSNGDDEASATGNDPITEWAAVKKASPPMNGTLAFLFIQGTCRRASMIKIESKEACVMVLVLDMGSLLHQKANIICTLLWLGLDRARTVEILEEAPEVGNGSQLQYGIASHLMNEL